jgi:hypothetical protein
MRSPNRFGVPMAPRRLVNGGRIVVARIRNHASKATFLAHREPFGPNLHSSASLKTNEYVMQKIGYLRALVPHLYGGTAILENYISLEESNIGRAHAEIPL